jgi:hypothetical protein
MDYIAKDQIAMQYAVYINFLSRMRYWIIAWALISVAFGVIWNNRNPPLYTSILQIHVDEPYVIPEAMAGITARPVRTVIRLIHQAGSPAMLKHIDEKFDLGGHYRIPRDLQYRDLIVWDILDGRMEVKPLDEFTFEVRVSDHDKDIAQLIAAEVYRSLAEWNSNRLTLDVQNIRTMIKQVREDLEGMAKQHDERLQQLIAATKGIPDISEKDLLFDLLNSLSKWEDLQDRIGGFRLSELQVAGLASAEQLPKLMLVKGPTVDLMLDPVRISLFRVIGITAFSVFTMITLLIVYLNFKLENRPEEEDMIRPIKARERGIERAPLEEVEELTL